MPIRYLTGYVVVDVPGAGPVPPDITPQALRTLALTQVAPSGPAYPRLLRHFPATVHDVKMYHLTLQEPFGEADYVIDVWGTEPASADPPGALQWHDMLYHDAPFAVTVWRRRVTYQRYGWIEIAWHPRHGDRTVVHHRATTLPIQDGKVAEKRLYAGLGFLRKIERGRKEGSGRYPERTAFRRDLIDTIRQVARRYAVTQARVAQQLPEGPSSARQLQRWFQEHIGVPEGVTWNTFVQGVRAP